MTCVQCTCQVSYIRFLLKEVMRVAWATPAEKWNSGLLSCNSCLENSMDRGAWGGPRP